MLKLNYILLNINDIIKVKNLNINKISVDLGMNKNTVSNYLRGKTELTLTFINNFCQKYECDPEKILFGVKSKKRYPENNKSSTMDEPSYNQKVDEMNEMMHELIKAKDQTINELKDQIDFLKSLIDGNGGSLNQTGS